MFLHENPHNYTWLKQNIIWMDDYGQEESEELPDNGVPVNRWIPDRLQEYACICFLVSEPASKSTMLLFYCMC